MSKKIENLRLVLTDLYGNPHVCWESGDRRYHVWLRVVREHGQIISSRIDHYAYSNPVQEPKAYDRRNHTRTIDFRANGPNGAAWKAVRSLTTNSKMQEAYDALEENVARVKVAQERTRLAELRIACMAAIGAELTDQINDGTLLVLAEKMGGVK